MLLTDQIDPNLYSGKSQQAFDDPFQTRSQGAIRVSYLHRINCHFKNNIFFAALNLPALIC
jgi:hypothetical protein